MVDLMKTCVVSGYRWSHLIGLRVSSSKARWLGENLFMGTILGLAGLKLSAGTLLSSKAEARMNSEISNIRQRNSVRVVS